MDTASLMAGLSGLGLFLFGIWLLEHGLRDLAGRSFKTLLRRHTDHPLKAIAAGTFATAVLQSSSVVSLILLALVGAGIIGLGNALGIVLGANLGTTMTGWIVTFVGFKVEIDEAILPVLAAGSLLFVFTEGRYGRLASWGRLLLGFGLLLFGLNLLKEAMGGVADQVDLVQYARYGPIPFAAAGFVFTAIIQSSSAAMVITLSALHSGVIELHSAAALVIGADLGTTTTVMMGGIGGSAVKKQVALGHFLFNLITDLIALAVLPLLLRAVVAVLGTDPLIALVGFHSSFNLLGIALFLPFLGRFARFLEARYQRDDGLPSGFEGIAEADPRFPPIALDALVAGAVTFLERTCSLNRQALRLIEPEGLTERILGERDFLDRYRELKEIEGRVLAVAAEVQSQPLDEVQTSTLGRVQQAVRNAGQSAKELRDVERNLRELEGSPSSTDQSALAEIQRRQVEAYEALLALVPGRQPDPESDPDGPAFTRLSEILDVNRRAYEAEVQQAIGPTGATGARLTDRLNVARETYTSTKRLVIAFADLMLVGEARSRFDGLPNR